MYGRMTLITAALLFAFALLLWAFAVLLWDFLEDRTPREPSAGVRKED